MTLPFVVIAALVIGATTGDGGSSPSTSPDARAPLSFTAPPLADAQAAPCAKVLAQLPVTLSGLAPRVVHTKPETPYVVAWGGDPPVVLRCGVARPRALHPGSAAQFVAGGAIPGPYYDVTKGDGANVWTTVDRAAYISITVPTTYNSRPLPALSGAIQRALPTAVCSTDNADPVATLCTRRT